MNKTKLAFWLILAGFFGAVIFQNLGFFMTRTGLDLNLLVLKTRGPKLPTVVYLLIFFLVGFLVAYFFSLIEKFGHGKTLKTLNKQLMERADTIARLESENDALKSAMTEARTKSQPKEEPAVEPAPSPAPEAERDPEPEG